MNAILLVVTALSVLVAAGSLVVAWRTVDRERRRLDARVAALLAAAAHEPAETDGRHEMEGAGAGVRRADAVPDVDIPVLEPYRRPDRSGEPAVDLQDGTGEDARPMFGAALPDRESPAFPRALAAVGAGAGLLVVVIGASLWLLGGRPAPAAPPSAPMALELLSLDHTRAPGEITISGLVRNPRSSSPVEALSAVVLFFDARGGFLTSARTPLDFRRLAPGEESPFRLTVAAPAGIGRYRISFRRAEGGVVPHVDRRSSADTAPAEAPQANPPSQPASRRAAL